jgi:cell division protein FtsB
MTPEDAATRIAEGLGALARSLDRLRGSLMILLGLALIGIGALAWQHLVLYRANADLHQQTRVIVQTNQALLAELLQRTPRTP